MIGSPIILDASLFKLEPPPRWDGGFLSIPVRKREYVHFLTEARRFCA